MRNLMTFLMLVCASHLMAQRAISFNEKWNIHYPQSSRLHAGETKTVTLPRAWNEDEAYRVGIASLPDDTCRYTKHFTAPSHWQGKHIFIEFEGARQAAEVWLNGNRLGLHENGVMAFGFELTPYININGENTLEVLTDNNWSYREKESNSTYQWNNKNFNMNMGGLCKNVKLHVLDEVYQTLPLYSNLGTTGIYVYGSEYDIKGHKVTANVESQVINSSKTTKNVALQVEILDVDNKPVAKFKGKAQRIEAGDTAILNASKRLNDIHFWSWGYGYLYTVRTTLIGVGDEKASLAETRTGFRKTEFKDGKFYLNDRCLMVHGYAQRSSNEWPAVGIDIPSWLSDYSNDLMVQSGANLVRWMHVTPSKQDIESCDRVGLIQAMPAGDAEKDANGRQWVQRTLLMRDAIIYNRNNPSIIFYECGNESISKEHMQEMVDIRNLYDPKGGRAIGSREMLDIDEAEYGGEMLYINKSGGKPMWAMEYCRDEGYRMYWDDYSYPWHQHGAGPLYRKADASAYNRNQDDLTIEQIRRWHDYFVVRPGMGKRVSSGGVKIIFSDTNTHGRSEMNYRTSGVVDAMRIEKDAFYAHQVMWNSWVDIEHHASHIIGHWNYQEGTVKDVYVVSTSPIVELFVNGKSMGRSEKPSYSFLHTFKKVAWESGEVKAIGYASDGTTVESTASHTTAGQPHHLKLTLMQNPIGGMKADGADLACVQIEVVDKNGQRCPLDNRLIQWTLTGEGEWRGGIGKTPEGDNYILENSVPVEAGVSRVLVRSTTRAGEIRLVAHAKGMQDAEVKWNSSEEEQGLLPCRLTRGETPTTPSYTDKKQTIDILTATAGANAENVKASFDDNELSEWRNDGKLSTAWIAYELKEATAVEEISLKLTGWRQRSYPLEVYADNMLVWKGNTEKTLGYVSLFIDKPVKAKKYTIRQTGTTTDKDAFGQVTELAGGNASDMDAKAGNQKADLRIIEVDFLKGI